MLQYLVAEGSKGGGNAESALGKGLHLKHAHRAVPDDSLAVLQLCLEALQGVWANVQALHTRTDMSSDAQACSCLNAAADVTTKVRLQMLHRVHTKRCHHTQSIEQLLARTEANTCHEKDRSISPVPA